MAEFVGEKIEVEKEPSSPRPLRFKWHGEVHEVAEVLEERVDIRHGTLPASSHKWYNRRHRRYYVLKDTLGDVFEIYLDYANRNKRTWWLVEKRKK